MADDKMLDLQDARDDAAISARLDATYDDVRLSDEASERILGALLAAQEQKGREAGPSDDVAAAAMPGAAARHPNRARLLVPIAATLVVAVIGLGAVQSLQVKGGASSTGTAQQAEAPSKGQSSAETTAEATVQAADAVQAPAAADEGDVAPTLIVYDGITYELVEAEGGWMAVDEGDVSGEPAPGIEADSNEPVEVLRIDGSDDVAVRFDDGVLYRATPV